MIPTTLQTIGCEKEEAQFKARLHYPMFHSFSMPLEYLEADVLFLVFLKTSYIVCVKPQIKLA
jgi:hypothetical protein